MEQQFLDIELGAGEGGLPSRRSVSGRPRRRRRLRRTMLWVGATSALLAGGGYVLMVRHVDPGSARAAITAELANVALHPGESIERTVVVYRRSPWDYFRSTHGVLAATSQRLLLLTLPPADRFSGDAERAVVERREFALDSLTRLDTGRVLMGLARGLVVRHGNTRVSLAVQDEERPRLRALVRTVDERRDSLVAAGQAAARLRALARQEARAPVWYTVRPGDALATIATTFSTTPERLREINRLVGDRIRVGDSILVKPGS